MLTGLLSNARVGSAQTPPAPIIAGEVELAGDSVEYTFGPVTTVRYPGAAFIKLHFRSFSLLPGDYVTVSDPAGLEVHRYPGSEYTTDGGEGFWPLSITGDTAVVTLHSSHDARAQLDASASGRGVEIDKYTRGYPPGQLAQAVQESTCGTNQRTDVACYETTYPTEFANAHAVARMLLNNGTSLCTGWRVGPNNHLFTNEHCITSQAQVNSAEAWFNYQRLLCGAGSVDTVTKVAGNTFLKDDVTLDFALFSVDDFNSITGFGYLDLDVRTPLLDEQIYIPQHGSGNPKEFGIDSDLNAGGLCSIDDAVRNGVGNDTDTGYRCDTIGGSSGSPVLARSSHQVIALHHFGSGNCAVGAGTNSGVRIDLIWPEVSAILGGGGGGTCPTSVALRDNPERENIRETLYRFRDEILGRSERGQRYVRLFYRYAEEATRLLERQPGLLARTSDAMITVSPKIQTLVETGTAVLSEEELVAIERVMDAFSAKASSGLRVVIRGLRYRDRYRNVLSLLGFRIEK